MVRWVWLLLGAAAFVSCERAPPWTPPRPPERTIAVATIFVDHGAAQAAADGTRERPFPTIAGALLASPPGALVRLAEGVYDEAFAIRSSAVLLGAGAGKTRIVAPAGTRGPVVGVAAERVELRDLAIEGGEVGIAVIGGSLRLTSVALREQRHAALVARDAEVAFVGGEVLSVAGGIAGHGLRLDGGTLDLSGSVFRRAGRRGVEMRRGKALLRQVDSSGSAVAALQAIDGADVTVEDGRFSALGGAALYAGGARLTVRRASVAWSEYGVMGFRGAELDVREADISDTSIAGIAMVGSAGVVAGCAIRRAGSDAAIVITNPPDEVRLLDNRITDPGPMGVHATQAEVVAEGNTIVGARLDGAGDLGDAVYAVDSELLLARNHLRGNAGSGITVTRSKLELEDNEVGGNVRAGLVLQDGSSAKVRGNAFERNGGPGVIVAERSRAMLAANSFADNSEVDVDQVCGGAGRLELRSGNKFLGPAAPRRRCP